MTAAHEALNKAIDELRAAGRGLPCDGDSRFIAEAAKERAQVVELCQPCPIRAECFAAGRRQKWGVWGGVDRSTHTLTTTSKTRRKDTT